MAAGLEACSAPACKRASSAAIAINRDCFITISFLWKMRRVIRGGMALVDPSFPDDLLLRSGAVELALVSRGHAPDIQRVLADPVTMEHLTWLLMSPQADGLQRAQERCRVQEESWRSG